MFKILLNVLKKTAGKKRRDPLLGAEDIETSSKIVSLFPTSGEEKGEGPGYSWLRSTSLPRQFRQVLWLVVVEGFAYKETAQMLDIPIGTVMFAALSRQA